MNYPVSRNCFLRALARAFAWLLRATWLRACRQSDSVIACSTGSPPPTTPSTACSSRRVSGTVRPVVVFPPQPPRLQYQEPHRQQHQRLVVLPPAPPQDLVVAQAQLPLAAQEAVLDRPARVPHPRQRRQRAVRRRITQVVLRLRLLVATALQQQPQLRARQAVAPHHHAHPGEVSVLHPLP